MAKKEQPTKQPLWATGELVDEPKAEKQPLWATGELIETPKAEKQPLWATGELIEEPVKPVEAKPAEDYSTLDFLSDAAKRPVASLISGTGPALLGIEEAVRNIPRNLKDIEGFSPPELLYKGLKQAAKKELSLLTGEPYSFKEELVSGIKEKELDKEVIDKAISSIPHVPGLQDLADWSQKTGQNIRDTISKQGQKVAADSQMSGNLAKAIINNNYSNLSFGKDPSLAGYALNTLDVLGSLAPVIATAVITKSPTATAVVGGGMGAGEGVMAAQQHINELSDAELTQASPYYASMVKQGMDPIQARKIVTDKAAEYSAQLQGAVATFGGNFTGKLMTGAFDKVLNKAVKNRLGKIAVAGAVGGAEEGTQEFVEGLATDMGINTAVVREIGTDSFANFLMGALGGVGPGAYAGYKAKPAEGVAPPVDTDIALPNTAGLTDEQMQETRDAYIKRIKEQIRGKAAALRDQELPEAAAPAVVETAPIVAETTTTPVTKLNKATINSLGLRTNTNAYKALDGLDITTPEGRQLFDQTIIANQDKVKEDKVNELLAALPPIEPEVQNEPVKSTPIEPAADRAGVSTPDEQRLEIPAEGAVETDRGAVDVSGANVGQPAGGTEQGGAPLEEPASTTKIPAIKDEDTVYNPDDSLTLFDKTINREGSSAPERYSLPTAEAHKVTLTPEGYLVFRRESDAYEEPVTEYIVTKDDRGNTTLLSPTDELLGSMYTPIKYYTTKDALEFTNKYLSQIKIAKEPEEAVAPESTEVMQPAEEAQAPESTEVMQATEEAVAEDPTKQARSLSSELRALDPTNPMIEDLLAYDVDEDTIAEARDTVAQLVQERQAKGQTQPSELRELSEDLAATEGEPEELPGEEVRFSKEAEGRPATAEDAHDATTLEDSLKALFVTPSTYKGKVKIYNNEEEARMAGALPEGQEGVQGFVRNGVASFIAGNISKGREIGVFLHELGAHLGFDTLLGPGNKQQLAKTIVGWAVSDSTSEATVLAKKALARAEQATDYPYGAEQEEYYDEVIAYFVEEAVNSGINPQAVNKIQNKGMRDWFRKFMSLMRTALRKIGLNKFQTLTPQNIVDLAYGAADLELSGAWHGTAADFRKFDHNYMGAGEGAQAFGWGTYLAQRRGIGKEYMDADIKRKSAPVPQTLEDVLGLNNIKTVKRTHSGRTMYIDGNSLLRERAGRLYVKAYDGMYDNVGSYVFINELYKPDGYPIFTPEELNKIRDKLYPKRKDSELSKKDLALANEYRALIASIKASIERLRNTGFPKLLALAEDRLALAETELADLLSKKEVPEGSLMRVRPLVAESELLDWDALIEDQPKAVRDIIENSIPDFIMEEAESFGQNVTGETLYRALQSAASEGDNRIWGATTGQDPKKAASMYLDRLGIPGLKFFDALSRNVPTIQGINDFIARSNDTLNALKKELEQERALPVALQDANYIERILSSITNFNKDIANAIDKRKELEKNPPKLTRNLVVFNDKNLSRVATQKGADNKKIRYSAAQEKTPAFKKWFGNSKIVDKEGKPLVIYRGIYYSSNEGALNAEAREGYAAFGSDNPYLSNTYANPEVWKGKTTGEGSIVPLYIKADKLIEFPVTTSRFDPDLRMFDKFEFDRRAQRLQPGEVLVARQVNDTGPRANLSVDSEKKFAKYSDIYAWNKGTSVKSAVGNRGTFDANNNDIRYSKKQQAVAQLQKKSGIKKPSNKTGKSLFKSVMDADLNHAIDNLSSAVLSSDNGLNNQMRLALEKAGMPWSQIKKILEGLMTSQATHSQNVATMFLEMGKIGYNKVANMFEVTENPNGSWGGMMQTISDLAKKYGMSMDEMELAAHTYFVANRSRGLINSNNRLKKKALALELAGKRKEADRLLDKIVLVNMTPAEIKAGLDIRKEIPELGQVVEQWNVVRLEVINHLVNTGLYSQEQAAELADTFDYVPFYREAQLEANQGPKENTRGLLDRARQKHIKGSYNPVNNVFDNMNRWITYSIARGINNSQGQYAVKAMQQYMVGSISPKPLPPTAKVPAGNLVAVWENGVEKRYRVEDPMFVHYFTGARAAYAPLINSWAVTGVNKVFRAEIILDPIFSAGQVVMDGLTGMFTSGVKHWYMIPIRAIKEFVLTIPNWSKTHKVLRGYGTVGETDFASVSKRLAEEAKYEARDMNTAEKIANTLLKPLRWITTASDNAIRQAIYEQEMAESGDKATALRKAFEIINFRRAGYSSLVNTLRQSVNFTGAYLQYINVTSKVLTGKGITPTQKKQTYVRLVNSLAGYGLLSFIIFMSVSDDDEYKETDQTTRDLRQFLPGITEKLGVWLPVRADPFMLIAKMLPEHIYNLSRKEGGEDWTKFKKAFKAYMASAALGPTPIPQLPKVALESMMNKSITTGRPIVGTGIEGRANEREFTSTTSEFSKMLGSTGLVSPVMADYWINNLGASVGRAFIFLTNALMKDSEAPQPSTRDKLASFAPKFIKREFGTRAKNDLYELRDIVDEAYQTYKDVEKIGSQAEYDKTYEETIDKVMAKPGIDIAINQLAQIRAEERLILESPPAGMTKQQKEDAIKKLRTEEQELLFDIQYRRDLTGLDKGNPFR